MAKPKPLPPIDYLHQRLRYEPDTGKLFWLDYEGMPQNWRVRYAGKEAFAIVHSSGYLTGKIDGSIYKAHRVAWAIYHGEEPTDQIDHINGIKADNCISNLRVVTNQENHRNSPRLRNNTSGVTGVSWNKKKQKWQALVMVNGRHKYLGCFDILEEAAIARAEASRLYGFSERHGLPTNVGEACD